MDTSPRDYLVWPGVLLHLGALIAIGGTAACKESAPPNRVETPLSGDPKGGPGDSLAKLHRQLLVDSNPRAIFQQILCEHRRLSRVHGEWGSEAIADKVMDTIFKPADKPARRRVDGILANSTFRMDCPPNDGATPKPVP